jgi:hypothetical protein
MTIVQDCGLWLERGPEAFNLGREKDDSAMFTVPVAARHRARPTVNGELYKNRMKAYLNISIAVLALIACSCELPSIA